MITITEKGRFYETDMMGLVHHSNQIRWFECGRCAYFDEVGLDLFELMDKKILFHIKTPFQNIFVNISITYKYS